MIYDTNRDGKLSKSELAVRYARRRAPTSPTPTTSVSISRTSTSPPASPAAVLRRAAWISHGGHREHAL